MPYKDPKRQRAAVRAEARRNQIRRTRVRQAELRAWANDIKAQAGCAHCGETDPVVLDFHHCNESKEFAVNAGIRRNMSRDRLTREIAKCIVLCANCHRREEARLGRASTPS